MTILECFANICKISAPPIIGNLISLSVILTSIYFVGNLNDPVVLASVGLGGMMVNVLAFAITQGLNGALEYYVSNSFGMKHYKECGQWLNRGKLVATIALLPVFFVFFNAEPILLKLGQDPEISHFACQYLRLVMPGIWA